MEGSGEIAPRRSHSRPRHAGFTLFQVKVLFLLFPLLIVDPHDVFFFFFLLLLLLRIVDGVGHNRTDESRRCRHLCCHR